MIRQFVLSGLLLVGSAAAPAATASAQGGLEATAPENLRCPGRPGPRDGYHFEVEWQSFATFPSVDLEALDASGKQVATWKSCDCEPGTPGWRSASQSSSSARASSGERWPSQSRSGAGNPGTRHTSSHAAERLTTGGEYAHRGA
jgi:hypothetical protein